MKLHYFIIPITAVLLLLHAISFAQEQQDAFARQELTFEEEEPVIFQADSLTYNQKDKQVIASGNVQIMQSGRTIVADEIIYYQEEDKVIARGHVKFIDADGQVALADELELSDELKNGWVNNIKIIFFDGSRLFSERAERVDGNESYMDYAAFTSCYLCEDDPTIPPLWQVRALKVIHDNEAQDIHYNDVWLDMWGLPIVYFPYLTHPDPRVKRRSGFLLPLAGSSDVMGAFLEIPYFWVINQSEDLTVKHRFTSNQGLVLIPEYRRRFSNGAIDLKGSGTIDPRSQAKLVTNSKFRGHFDGTGRFSIDDNWRAGFDLLMATDQTYLRGYEFGNPSYLTDILFAEGFYDEDYLKLEMMTFQNQRDITVETDPFIVPYMQTDFRFHPKGRPFLPNTVLGIQGSFREIARENSPNITINSSNSQRLALVPYMQWSKIHSSTGLISEVLAWTQFDIYQLKNFYDQNGNLEEGIFVFGQPQFSYKLRYPWISSLFGGNLITQPIFAGIIAPTEQNWEVVPDEDSRGFELDDTNIFEPDRLPGRDRTESGPRIYYGFETTYIGKDNAYISFLLGQNYNFSDVTLFQDNISFDITSNQHASDIVGRFIVKPNEYLDATYRFAYDHKTLNSKKQEATLSAGVPIFKLNGTYSYIAETVIFNGSNNIEELSINISSKLTDFWTLYLGTKRDLENGFSPSHYAQIRYEDECFGFGLNVARINAIDRDIQPGFAVLATVTFKALGQAETITFPYNNLKNDPNEVPDDLPRRDPDNLPSYIE